MKNFLIVFSILFFLFSCSGSKKTEEIESVNTEDIKGELDVFFKDNYSTLIASVVDKSKLDSTNLVQIFYSMNNHSLIWINDSLDLTKNGKELIKQLSSSRKHGLETSLYNVSTLLKTKDSLKDNISKQEKFALASKLEILLSHDYMLYGKHLNYGVLDSIDSLSVLPRRRFTTNLPQYLQRAYQSDSIIDKLLELQPTQPEYLNLQKGLEKYLETSSLSTENVLVQNYRKDSIKAISQSKKALILHNYLSEATKDSLYVSALKKFQIEHGLRQDGLIGKNTASALSHSPYYYYKQLVINLERWKWKENWAKNYFYVNVPSYELQLVRNHKWIKNHKVVVGKFKNQTPEIVDTLEYIIAYPFWNVPRKISVKEILGKVKRDSTYLTRNNYEIMSYSRKIINPDSINWKKVNRYNFKYLIRQKGGGSNALGLVKFIFPNKHAIYFHDTPSKRFFKKETRAYSHGCVRVDKALDLARFILKEDHNENTIDSVYASIKKKKRKPIKLKQQVPVYIYYFTASADSLGNITFYNDVYKRDDKLIAELILDKS